MNNMMRAGLVIVSFLLLAAVAAPLLTKYDYRTQDISNRLKSPSSEHILGTDELGRDVFSRMVYGARISMAVGIVAVLIAVFLGVILGAAAGYFGGAADNIIMRLVAVSYTHLTLPTKRIV